MSPTVFREGPYRFFFFSREESRLHVHVASSDGEAEFWLAPRLELAENHGLSETEITIVASGVYWLNWYQMAQGSAT